MTRLRSRWWPSLRVRVAIVGTLLAVAMSVALLSTRWFAPEHFSDEAAASACAAQIIATQAARAYPPDFARPVDGWQTVSLPDLWTRRWPAHEGSVWYRIDWTRGCGNTAGATSPAQDVPLALGIDAISVAGAVYSNDVLLWRDQSLQEPLSRSWNVARWWLLPEPSLRDGVNTVWVRAVGPSGLSPGLSRVRVGTEALVEHAYRYNSWNQRTVYFVNAVICAMAAAMFLLVWSVRPQESAYGWFALMSLSWLAYLTTYFAESQWPWSHSIDRSRFSLVAMISYVVCACMFTFRLGAQDLPRAEKALWTLGAVGVAAAVTAPTQDFGVWSTGIWRGAMGVFLLNCLQFQWHAWRPRPAGREAQQMLLSVCWLVFLVVAVLEFSGVQATWEVARSWAALSGLLSVGLVMLLLGAHLTQRVDGAEAFNRELEERIAVARSELANSARREREGAVEHAKLQERLQLARDLHDGLGGSLVRSLALVERARDPLSNDRMLSLLKTLRDDLRQVIDQESSHDGAAPETPTQWIAPLRHRYTRILDELGIDTKWCVPAQWTVKPTALQCLALIRILEEALSNVIKHSQARTVCVECSQSLDGVMRVCATDNGVGFDVDTAAQAGQGIGMRSMLARALRVGGTLSVESIPGCTTLVVEIQPQQTRQGLHPAQNRMQAPGQQGV